MRNDGKKLEQLVAFIESLYAPAGLQVTSGRRVYEDSMQLAEFDVEVRGRIGTTDFSWLIECRDRPSEGPAPPEWVQQCAARMEQFNFQIVSAVSTTGFTPAAKAAASHLGVDLREMQTLDEAAFGKWIKMRQLEIVERGVDLRETQLLLSEDESDDRRQAVGSALAASADTNAPLLTRPNGSKASTWDACVNFLVSRPDLATPEFEVIVNYDPTDRYSIATSKGNVPVLGIRFKGFVKATKRTIPISQVEEYRKVLTGENIGQTATFDFQVRDQSVKFAFHHREDTGETHVGVQATKKEQQ